MPFIHVRSLPFDPPRDISAVVSAVCRDFAAAARLDPKHVHVTWEFLPPGHYAAGGTAPSRQPTDSHPLLVDILTPDFFDAKAANRMISAAAESLAARADFPIGNIFVQLRQAPSGTVFDGGGIVRWPMSRPATADPN